MDKPWMVIARKEMGVSEIPGPRNNPRIIEYHSATELSAKDEDTSWCSSFPNWVFKQVGIRGTNSAAARSWLDWGREPNDDEYEGCICVLWRVDPDGWQGHVGFLADWTDDEDNPQVQLLGGNQSNKVSLAWFPMERVLGYRVPMEA